MVVRYACFLLVINFTVVGCGFKTHHDKANGEVAEGQVVKSSRDSQLPRALTSQIQNLYIAEYHRYRSQTSATDRELLDLMKRRLLDVTVLLTNPTHGVLESGVRFALPTGGGTVDLAEYVKEDRGSFAIKFEFPDLEPSLLPKLHVFFVSNARQRKILGDSYGTGCDQFVDITTYFRQTLTSGIQVFGSDQRYLSVLAGTYFFVIASDDNLYLGTFTLTDSRYTRLLCQP